MTAEDVLCRVREHGWKVRLTAAGPVCERAAEGVPKLPDAILANLKAHRALVVRHLVYVGLLARANGKAIWGYDSADGRVRETYPKKGIPNGWDRLCVEGDSEWTPIPKICQNE